MMRDIPVFFASNDNYAPYLAASIVSICKNTKARCIFYIIDDNISKENEEKIKAIENNNVNAEIRFIPVDTASLFINLPEQFYFSKSTYLKFIIPMLQSEYDKVVYLDCDIIFNTDIELLFDQDLCGMPIGACVDFCLCNNPTHYSRIGFPESSLYINAGMLIIDCKKWRAEGISDSLMNLATHSTSKMFLADQDVINSFFVDKCKILPAKYNWQMTRSLAEEPVKQSVIHYCLNAEIKPWMIEPDLHSSIIEKRWEFGLFWEYLKLTEFYSEVIKKEKTNRDEVVRKLQFMSLIAKKTYIGMKENLISVIIPIKNGERYLEEAINGINKQNMNVEIIVVDDASSDSTPDIATKLGCTVVRHDICKGKVACKNAGLEVSKGQYVMFHDADEVMRDGVLKQMYEELKSDKTVSAVMSQVNDLLSPELSVLIRKTVFDEIRPFDKSLHSGEIINWKSELDNHGMKIKKLNIVSTDRRIH